MASNVVESIMQPEEGAIKEHLETLFAPLREEYPSGLIELRHGSPAPNRSSYFNIHPDGIADAVAFAAARSRAGDNVYVGVNPRKATAWGSGSANDTDVEIAAWQFADIDKAEALEGLGRKLRALPPTFTVNTGNTPNRRPHLYWQLEEPVRNMAEWTQRQRGIAATLEGDAVINPSRIMRLAGTVNFPPPHKFERGYRVEVVGLRTQFDDEREPVTPDEVVMAFPVPAGGHDFDFNTAKPLVEGQNTLQAMARTKIEHLLDACRTGDNWHNNMVILTGHLAGIGRGTTEILALADHITLPGYTVEQTRRDMLVAVKGARQKYGLPEPEEVTVEQAQEALGDTEFVPTAWVPMDPASIPPREWLFGDILARRFVSVLVAPPGVGKSILTIEVAICAALKMSLGPFKAHEQTKVWLFNNEDPRDELNRRISAFLIATGADSQALAGNLFVDTGEERHLMVAKYDQHGNVMRMPVVDRMIEHIERLGIGLLIVDPFIETHGVNENSNNDINVVARLYREIAQKTGCAVWLVHHTRKTPAGAVQSAPGDSDVGRGASALGGVARFTATLFNMSQQDAKALGIAEEDRHLYVRFDDGKANLKLKTGDGIWWRKASVSLDNARGFRPADSMGVLEWADMAPVMAASSEKQREQWAIVGHALCVQMDGQEDITLHAASKLVEKAGEQAGLTSLRSVERLLIEALAAPKIVGAWKLSYINEKRGNGSHWVRKEEAATWGQ
jgi:hypothetical protein